VSAKKRRTMRDAEERLTFDDASWVWLTSKPPTEMADFLEGARWLLDELGTRGHVYAEQGETPEDLRISMRFLDLPRTKRP
jgi:hypothetical protein